MPCRAAGLPGSDGLLALSEDDTANLAAVTAAWEVAPGTPAVVRTFQPALAERLEAGLAVRRAWSSSALAAPAFAAAAVSETVVETLTLQREEIPLCVIDAGEGSPLVGLTPDAMKQAHGCALVARSRPGGSWVACNTSGDGSAIEEGDRLLVGGRLHDVLSAAAVNQPDRGLHRVSRRMNWKVRHRRGGAAVTTTLLPVAVATFVALLATTALVYARALDLGPLEALDAALAGAFGGPAPSGAHGWVLGFSIASTLAAVTLATVLVSHVAAVLLASRFEERMSRRARRIDDHVVVAGLGRVGYRVTMLLDALGIPVVALDTSPHPRFLEVVAERVPVLLGDVTLPENLARAGIERARCIIACTDDDLANLTACLEARLATPAIRTVARVFDDDLAARLAGPFDLDEVVSVSRVAAPAFVGAIVDELAMRTLHLDGIDLAALRMDTTRRIPLDELRRWRDEGVRVLALVRDGQVLSPRGHWRRAWHRGRALCSWGREMCCGTCPPGPRWVERCGSPASGVGQQHDLAQLGPRREPLVGRHRVCEGVGGRHRDVHRPGGQQGQDLALHPRAAWALSSRLRARRVEPWIRPRAAMRASRFTSALAPAPTPMIATRPPVANALRSEARLGAPTSSRITSKGPWVSKPSGSTASAPIAATAGRRARSRTVATTRQPEAAASCTAAVPTPPAAP